MNKFHFDGSVMDLVMLGLRSLTSIRVRINMDSDKDKVLINIVITRTSR